MDDDCVTLLFLAKCEEVNFFPAKRALNKEIFKMATDLNFQTTAPSDPDQPSVGEGGSS